MLTPQNVQNRIKRIIEHLPEYPGGFDGRGIVVVGGGLRYFPCAWVCINMLRRLGCVLPIELWYLGPSEMTEQMKNLISPLGVQAIDALEVRKLHPARLLNGWELKPYAVIHSRFREVLLLDADNVAVVDPTFLFETPQYLETGGLFWPDFDWQLPSDEIWQLLNLSRSVDPGFESGQLLVDKKRCWKPLLLTMWMNEHSDFWYEYVLGDKETFRFAWKVLGVSYAMPPHPLFALDGVMCQHAFSGRRLFQHRNLAKWSLGENRRIPGFLLESECLEDLATLGKQWRPSLEFLRSMSESDRQKMQLLARGKFQYVRVGYDCRPMRFSGDGLVVEGTGGCETFWWMNNGELVISNDLGKVTCRLHESSNGVFEGVWLVHEKMPVRLMPMQS